MKKDVVIYYLMSLLILWACSNYNEPTGNNGLLTELKIINPLESKAAKNQNLLPEFLKVLDVVRLETSQQALVGNIDKIIYVNQHYYIMDRRRAEVKVFYKDGSFDYLLGIQGRGPGEYINVADIGYIEDRKLIFLYASHTHSILSFDFDGSYIFQIDNITFNAKELEYFNDKFIFSTKFLPRGQSKDDQHNLLITNTQINVQKKAFPYNYSNPSSPEMSGFLIKNTSGALYSESFSDTIFQITDTSIYPIYKINLGNDIDRGIIIDDFMSNQHKLLNSSYLSEKCADNKRALIFSFTHHRRSLRCVWLKDSDLSIANTDWPNPSMLTFWESIYTINDTSFIAYVKPMWIRKLLDDYPTHTDYLSENFPDFYNKIKDVKEGDNPILLHFGIKKSALF